MPAGHDADTPVSDLFGALKAKLERSPDADATVGRLSGYDISQLPGRQDELFGIATSVVI